MRSILWIISPLLLFVAANSALAIDTCKNIVTAENLDGKYLLVLGDMSIDNGYDPEFPANGRITELSDKAIWLPLTAETMETRIAFVNGTLFLSDGNSDVTFNISEKFDRKLAMKTYSLFADLQKGHSDRFKEWAGVSESNDKVFTPPCYPNAATFFLSEPTTVSGVQFAYDFHIVSHSELSTLMVGRLIWIGINGVVSLRDAMLLRGQFSRRDYWSE